MCAAMRGLPGVQRRAGTGVRAFKPLAATHPRYNALYLSRQRTWPSSLLPSTSHGDSVLLIVCIRHDLSFAPWTGGQRGHCQGGGLPGNERAGACGKSWTERW